MQLTSFLQIKHHRQGYEIYNTQSLEQANAIFPKDEDAAIFIGKEIFLPFNEDNDCKKFKVVDFNVQFKKELCHPNHLVNYTHNDNEPDEGYQYNTVIQLFVDDQF